MSYIAYKLTDYDIDETNVLDKFNNKRKKLQK
jgi:hypothetical protein